MEERMDEGKTVAEVTAGRLNDVARELQGKLQDAASTLLRAVRKGAVAEAQAAAAELMAAAGEAPGRIVEILQAAQVLDGGKPPPSAGDVPKTDSGAAHSALD